MCVQIGADNIVPTKKNTENVVSLRIGVYSYWSKKHTLSAYCNILLLFYCENGLMPWFDTLISSRHKAWIQCATCRRRTLTWHGNPCLVQMLSCMNEAELAPVTVPTLHSVGLKEKNSQSFIVIGELKVATVFGLHVWCWDLIYMKLYISCLFSSYFFVKCKKLQSLENYMTFEDVKFRFVSVFFAVCVYKIINLFVLKLSWVRYFD